MDQHRFDALTRTIATGGTRRTLLRGLAAAISVAVFGGPRRQEALADDGCKPFGKKCNKDHQCCSGICDPDTGTCGGFCSSNADCDDGDPCTYDVCGTLSGQCFHDPIPNCTSCRGNGHCAKGETCCDHRCCPAGSICIPDPKGTGRQTCCEPCGDTYCCDGYAPDHFVARNCVEPCGFCCNGGNGECLIDSNGNVVEATCVLPGISR